MGALDKSAISDHFHRIAQPSVWLSICAVLAPSVCLFAGAAAAPFFIVSAFFMVWCGFSTKPWKAIPVNLAVPLGIALAWGLIACAWTPTPAVRSVRTLLDFAGLTGFGLMTFGLVSRFDPTERMAVGKSLVVGVGLAAALLLVEVSSHYAITRSLQSLLDGQTKFAGLNSAVSRGVVLLVLTAWPAFAVIIRLYGKRVAVPLFFALVVAVFGNGKHATILALVSACLAFVLVRLMPDLALKVFRAAAVVMVLAMPLIGYALPQIGDLGQSDLFNSARHRVVIWRFSVDHIAEHPWRGWGMNASRTIPGGSDATSIAVPSGGGGDMHVFRYQNMPLHPHNGPLQIWLELGGLGAVLLAAVVGGVIGNVGRVAVDPREAACQAAAVTGALVIGSLSFGIWQSWWQSALWLTAILFAATRPAAGTPREETMKQEKP